MESSYKQTLLILLVFIFGLAAGFGGTFFFKKEVKNGSTITTATNSFTKTDSIKIPEEKTNWVKPASTKKGYPIYDSKTNELSIFLIDSKELKNTGKKTSWGSGASGFGSTDSIASPDLLYTAYIDKESQELKLLSNETFTDVVLSTPGEKVSYISGWSPDSKKIIYYIDQQTLATRKTGMMPWEGKEKFNKKLNPGFIIFNIETGERESLYPVAYFISFIDNNRILVKAGEDEFMGKRLIVFDFSTFEADYSFVKEEFGYGANQFTFSENGKKWTYTLSRKPTEDANIIYADFPNKEGVDIDSGGWADVQFPYISPSGSKIAYWKKEGYVSDGVLRFTVWIYDEKSKLKEKYAEGMIMGWIDENRLIYRVQNTSVTDSTFYLLDLTSKQSTKMN